MKTVGSRRTPTVSVKRIVVEIDPYSDCDRLRVTTLRVSRAFRGGMTLQNGTRSDWQAEFLKPLRESMNCLTMAERILLLVVLAKMAQKIFDRRDSERVGFEPTVEFPLHTLSKRA